MIVVTAEELASDTQSCLVLAPAIAYNVRGTNVQKNVRDRMEIVPTIRYSSRQSKAPI